MGATNLIDFKRLLPYFMKLKVSVCVAVTAIRLWLLKVAERAGVDALEFQALLVGLLGGLSAALFRAAELDIRWLTEGTCQDLIDYARQLTPGFRILIPTLGGLIAGGFLWLSQRGVQLRTVIDYLEAIRLQNGQIPLIASLARTLSSLTSITSGASIGREGGMVQLSAATASLLGRVMRLNPIRLRLLVACGAAAGVSSAYNTPLAATLFIAEVVLGTMTIDIHSPLMIASVSAAVLSREWLGIRPLFEVPDFATQIEIPVQNALALGVLAGLVAPLFLITLQMTRGLFMNIRFPPLQLALGGFLVGLLSLRVPEVWGNGHAVVAQILDGQMLLPTVAAIFLFKALATAASFGSGTVGGIQTPTLTLGACLGWLFSQLVEGCAQQSIAYAALGMGALLAGTTLAPIMAIVMIFEMTLDAALFFPLIISAYLAQHLAAAIRPLSVYDKKTLSDNHPNPMNLIVGDIASPPGVRIDPAETMGDLFSRHWWRGPTRLWVCDPNGHYLGCVTLSEVARAVRHGRDEVQAAEVLHKLPSVGEETPLLALLPSSPRRHKTPRLPVTDHQGFLSGELSPRDVLLALNAHLT